MFLLGPAYFWYAMHMQLILSCPACLQGFQEELKQWDVSFWAERLQEAKFNITDEELRPYFALPNVLKGLFQVGHLLPPHHSSCCIPVTMHPHHAASTSHSIPITLHPHDAASPSRCIPIMLHLHQATLTTHCMLCADCHCLVVLLHLHIASNQNVMSDLPC